MRDPELPGEEGDSKRRGRWRADRQEAVRGRQGPRGPTCAISHKYLYGVISNDSYYSYSNPIYDTSSLDLGWAFGVSWMAEVVVHGVSRLQGLFCLMLPQAQVCAGGCFGEQYLKIDASKRIEERDLGVGELSFHCQVSRMSGFSPLKFEPRVLLS